MKKTLIYRLAAALALVVVGLTAAALAQYRLGAGDKIEVSVYGAPDLQRRGAISADGTFPIPLVGNVTLKGLTLDEAKERLQGLLKDKGIVKLPDVSIDVSEYRPFFMSGDLSRPGSYPYQPGLTVRQAVALAGGYDLVRFHFGQNPFVQAAELRSDYDTLRNDLMREQLRLRRVMAELDGKPTANFGSFSDVPTDPAVFDEAVAIERRRLAENLDSAKRERASLGRSLDLARERLVTLKEQATEEVAGTKQQDDQVDKVRQLYDKGLVAAQRLLDEQRSALLNRSRLASITSEAAAAKRAVEEAERQTQRFEENRTASLLKEKAEALSTLDRLQSRITSTAEKFAIIGSARSAVVTAAGTVPEVTIFRRTGEKAVRIQTDEDATLLPGDVVEITLKAGKLLGMAVQ